MLLYLGRDVFFKCTTGSHFTSSGKHWPMRTTTKTVKLVLPVENLMYSSVNLDGGYMKRSFVFSQWFLLSSETTASRVLRNWNFIGISYLFNNYEPSNKKINMLFTLFQLSLELQKFVR